jgi:mRNA interferase HigB
VRIIAKRTLVEFWESGHGDAEQPLKAWHALAKAANWSQPNEIKAKFSTASFLANNRVVFNISGNKYRLVVKVVYELKTIYIRFIGSHADYDRIDASTISEPQCNPLNPSAIRSITIWLFRKLIAV